MDRMAVFALAGGIPALGMAFVLWMAAVRCVWVGDAGGDGREDGKDAGRCRSGLILRRF